MFNFTSNFSIPHRNTKTALWIWEEIKEWDREREDREEEMGRREEREWSERNGIGGERRRERTERGGMGYRRERRGSGVKEEWDRTSGEKGEGGRERKALL